MPTYDYVCDACDHSFAQLQSMSDPVLKKCPQCGKKKLRRLFGTGAAIVFKGSGFYATDYANDKYKAAAQKDQAPTAGSTEKAGDKGAAAPPPAAPAKSDGGGSEKKAK